MNVFVFIMIIIIIIMTVVVIERYATEYIYVMTRTYTYQMCQHKHNWENLLLFWVSSSVSVRIFECVCVQHIYKYSVCLQFSVYWFLDIIFLSSWLLMLYFPIHNILPSIQNHENCVSVFFLKLINIFVGFLSYLIRDTRRIMIKLKFN